MSIETLIAELTTAIKDNTAAHAKLAEVATAAARGKATTTAKEEPKEEPKEEAETPAAKKKRLAAEKKKAEAEAEKKDEAEAEKGEAEKPELAESVTHDELHKLAGKFLASDDADVRDNAKSNFVGALAHLGAKKLTELEDDAQRARVAGYITYWMAGLEVDFDEIDALIPDAEGDDDPLG